MHLTATTIIPPSLYVQRGADRQLQKVIDEMGRPGYVLVARQMGKTNLLLNLKRKNEGNGNVFLYYDLSSQHVDLRQFFRGMIDLALEVHGDLFPVSPERIRKSRGSIDVSPQREHEAELRCLLSEIPGKLVIILDEIDALTNASFSDYIFAQIRSIYFSRINFKEFERLTYVLSGVADPTQLIKDKAISPFNIGTKIYLDDFSVDEAREFCRLAEISVAEAVFERVYYWASGNPRMTWDIFSEVERLLAEGSSISETDIDSIVGRIYLTDYGQPPIDHIRRLVEIDRDIRSGVIQLCYKKGGSLSDEVKSKLYLAGIIRADFSPIAAQFKNKIIEGSLAIKWIEDLERKERGILLLAQERVDGGRYSEVIKLFEDFIVERGSFPETERDICYYLWGFACHQVSRFQNAIECFEKCDPDPASKNALFHGRLLYVGLSYFRLGNFERSAEKFSDLIDSPGAGEMMRLKGMLNLAGSYLKRDASKNSQEIIALNTKVIEGVKSLNEDGGRDDRLEMISLAYNNLGIYYEGAMESSVAAEQYLKGARDGLASLGPALLTKYVEIERDDTRAYAIAAEASASIQSLRLIPKFGHNDGPLEFTADVALSISALVFKDVDEFQRLTKYYEGLPDGRLITPRYQYFNGMAVAAIGMKRPSIALKCVEKVIEINDPQSYEDGIIYDAFKYIFITKGTISELAEKVESYYIDYLLKSAPGKVDLNDLTVLGRRAGQLAEPGKRSDEVRMFLEKCLRVVDIMGPDYRGNKMLFLHYLMLNSEFEGDEGEMAVRVSGRSRIARDILNVVAEAGDISGWRKAAIFTEVDFKYIKSRAMSSSLPISRSVGAPVSSSMGRVKYGRNDIVRVQYADGRILAVKYKKIDRDIEGGLCRIL